ncbi:MAG: tyrosine kinase [Methanosaeta sp. PtaU1.Bin112]|jgi:chromosome partitioning protein|nr:MAG: tyrosine kinase [Methanosaeta sp. PtaU1.Bin112]
MEVVAIANQKGGCGKTTTAVNLSACLAAKGKKVLLIDLDPQGSATTHLAISSFEDTMYEAMIEDLNLSQLIKTTEINGLDIIPADKRLGRAEMEIASKSIARERILKPKIRILDTYDLIIIDTPPNLGFLTINAMVASDTVLVPIQTEFFAIQGLSMILDLAKAISEGLGQDLKLRYLLTMYDARTKMGKEVITRVRGLLGEDVFDVVIPRSIKLAEAPSYGKPIHMIDPEVPAAIAYSQLADEVIA